MEVSSFPTWAFATYSNVLEVMAVFLTLKHWQIMIGWIIESFFPTIYETELAVFTYA